MISFILNFCSIDKGKHIHIPGTWGSNNYYKMVSTTLKVIKNIQQHKFEHEIILIDNSHNWPNITLSNVRVVKGFQSMTTKELENNKWFNLHNDTAKLSNMTLENDTMWASLGFYLGTKKAKYDTIVLQHNDVYYHTDVFDMLVEDLNRYAYVSVDNKKVWLSTYVNWYDNKHFSKYLGGKKISPEDGGYVKSEFGFADAYFFICKKEFFDDYDVDWRYGDTNHGATIKCLDKGLKYKHLGPYYDNPNFDTPPGLHTYQYGSVDFCTHLKGGISECKMTDLMFQEEIEEWLANL